MKNIVSVVVPVYNGEKKIEHCIKSILNSDYKELEVIVIDDGSTDSTSEIVKKLIISDSRVKYYKKINSGVSSARNLGLKMAVGDYIAFVDADDWIEKNMYSNAIDSIKCKDADYCICGGIKNERGIKTSFGVYETKEVNTSKDILNRMYVKNDVIIGVWSIVFKKELIADIKFDERLKKGEDSLFVLNAILNAKKGMMISGEYYHYIKDDYGLSSSEVDEETIISEVKATEKQLSLLRAEKTIYRKCKYMILRDSINCCKKYIKNDIYWDSYKKYLQKLMRKNCIGIFNSKMPKKATLLAVLNIRLFELFYKCSLKRSHLL